jgi:hypothetical protein
MALVRDFEIPNTGVTVNNAYHVIVNVTTEKRLTDVLPPPDSSRPDGLTLRDDEDTSQWVNWKSGYVGRITLEIYASKEARDEGKTPIGAIGTNPTDVMHPDLKSVCTPGRDFKVLFFIDPESSDSILTQAYKHLLSTEYYKDVEEV